MSWVYTNPTFLQFCLKLSEQRIMQGLPTDKKTMMKLYEEANRLQYIPMEAYGPNGPIINIKALLEKRRNSR